VTRASNVPYHQNVYDLLQLEPGESPEAAQLIAEHEARHGPVPASVREWYLVPQVLQKRLYPLDHLDHRLEPEPPPGMARTLRRDPVLPRRPFPGASRRAGRADHCPCRKGLLKPHGADCREKRGRRQPNRSHRAASGNRQPQ
jgi:hypothetical protein